MRTRSIVRTMKTVCGKTVTFLQVDGQPNKAHNIEGPAIVYPDSEKKAPEYYLFGIKYSKARWKELISAHKATSHTDSLLLDM